MNFNLTKCFLYIQAQYESNKFKLSDLQMQHVKRSAWSYNGQAYIRFAKFLKLPVFWQKETCKIHVFANLSSMSQFFALTLTDLFLKRILFIDFTYKSTH